MIGPMLIFSKGTSLSTTSMIALAVPLEVVVVRGEKMQKNIPLISLSEGTMPCTFKIWSDCGLQSKSPSAEMQQ